MFYNFCAFEMLKGVKVEKWKSGKSVVNCFAPLF